MSMRDVGYSFRRATRRCEDDFKSRSRAAERNRINDRPGIVRSVARDRDLVRSLVERHGDDGGEFDSATEWEEGYRYELINCPAS